LYLPDVASYLSSNVSYYDFGFSAAAFLVLIGFAFKAAVVPFHFWSPDVYEGAPTSVTAYMASVVKVAVAGASLRFIYVLLNAHFFSSQLNVVLWCGAVLSMVLGNFLGLRQNSIKRMLAYSSVAHVGYMILGLLALKTGGASALLYYVIVYGVMTLGAFGVVHCVEYLRGRGDTLSAFEGLGKTQPFLAGIMALFMFALAGLPPGLSGLLGKFYLFNAAIQGSYVWVVVIAVLSTVVSCFYYLRVVVFMYFKNWAEGEGENKPEAGEAPFFALCLLFLCGLFTVLAGVFPSILHNAALF
ncbi:MAG: NADH-quinone oxidoreductase subunit N, partial [Candidatus Dadabacteria bacterium]